MGKETEADVLRGSLQFNAFSMCGRSSDSQRGAPLTKRFAVGGKKHAEAEEGQLDVTHVRGIMKCHWMENEKLKKKQRVVGGSRFIW